MNIVIISPPFNLFKEGYGTEYKIKQGNVLPLGIAFLGAALEAKGHVVKIIDAPAMGLSIDGVIRLVEEFDPAVIGISVFTSNAPVAIKLIDAMRRALDVPIIVGGPHVNCFPNEVLQEYDVDAIVVGEGERTLPELIDVFFEKQKWPEVKGIGFKGKDNEIIITPPREYVHNLDTLPIPARHLFNNNLYCSLPNQYKRRPNTVMLTSRGCPYKCDFCFQGGKFGAKFRRHSVKRIISEIKNLQEQYAIKEISFWDDIFTLDKQWVFDFCEQVLKQKMDLTWTCCGRINTMTRELLMKMSEAGCFSIFYGLESGNQELLDAINKGFSLDEARRVVGWTHEAGMETRGSFMLALPGETPQMADKTVDFAIELNLTYAQFLSTYPMPGTKLYDKAIGKGRFMEYKSFKKANYVPDDYSGPEEVDAVIRKAYKRFYMRPAYFMKHLKKLSSIEDAKRYLSGFKFIVGMAIEKRKKRV